MQRKGADIRMFFKRLLKTKSLVLLLMVSMLSSMIVFAEEDPEVETELVETEPVNESEEIVSVVLPVVEDSDPFSFFIDPLNILYNSFEDSDEVTVEEGTNLLFINRQSDKFALSSRSDMLTITNQSTVPVDVTLIAKIDNLDSINMMQTSDFGESDACELYLALVDDEGNEQPLSETGEVSITVRLDQLTDSESGAIYDSYSFGLKGACNKDGDWSKLSCSPYISVTWNVEPVLSDAEDITEPVTDESLTEESITEESVKEESLTEEPIVEDPDIVEPSPDSVSDNKALNQDSKDTDADNNSNESDDNSNDTDTEEQEEENNQTVSSNSASDSK